MIHVTTSTIPTMASGNEMATIAIAFIMDLPPFFSHRPSRIVGNRHGVPTTRDPHHGLQYSVVHALNITTSDEFIVNGT
jgi:hypothetical protein